MNISLKAVGIKLITYYITDYASGWEGYNWYPCMQIDPSELIKI